MNWKKYVESNRVMICQDCLRIAPFDLAGHQEDYYCTCGGQWCGCPGCNVDAKRLINGVRSKAVFGGTSDVPDTWTPENGIPAA